MPNFLDVVVVSRKRDGRSTGENRKDQHEVHGRNQQGERDHWDIDSKRDGRDTEWNRRHQREGYSRSQQGERDHRHLDSTRDGRDTQWNRRHQREGYSRSQQGDRDHGRLDSKRDGRDTEWNRKHLREGHRRSQQDDRDHGYYCEDGRLKTLSFNRYQGNDRGEGNAIAGGRGSLFVDVYFLQSKDNYWINKTIDYLDFFSKWIQHYYHFS